MTYEGFFPSDNTAERYEYYKPTEWLAKVYDHRIIAGRSDSELTALTKKFVISFAGSNKFPFQHDRVRLRPKNRMPDMDVVVAGLRFPEGREGIAFVSWELSDGSDKYFLLTPDQFSQIDINEVFSRIDDGIWIAPEAVTAASQEDISNLEIILNSFEADLQNNRPELSR